MTLYEFSCRVDGSEPIHGQFMAENVGSAKSRVRDVISDEFGVGSALVHDIEVEEVQE